MTISVIFVFQLFFFSLESIHAVAKESISQRLNNIENLAKIDYKSAIKAYYQLIRDYSDNSRLTSRAYYEIGYLYFNSERNINKAINMWEKALTRYSKKNKLAAIVLMSLGDAYFLKKEIEKSEFYYQKAHELSKSINFDYGINKSKEGLERIKEFKKKTKDYKQKTYFSSPVGIFSLYKSYLVYLKGHQGINISIFGLLFLPFIFIYKKFKKAIEARAVKWTGSDILLILFSDFFIGIFISVVCVYLFHQFYLGEEVGKIVSNLSILGIIFLLFKSKYHLSFKSLFEFNSSYKLKTKLFWGIITGIGLIMLSRIYYKFYPIPLYYKEAAAVSGIMKIGLVNIALKANKVIPFSIVGLSYFNMIIVSPLYEELIYRGIIFRFFYSKLNLILAIVFSAILFMFIHKVTDMPMTFIFGLIFAILIFKTKSLYPAIIAHAIFNTFA